MSRATDTIPGHACLPGTIEAIAYPGEQQGYTMTCTTVSVMDLVRQGLRALGADGLCRDDCGCSIDDLAPCGDFPHSCEAAQCEVLTEPRGDCGMGDRWFSPLLCPRRKP